MTRSNFQWFLGFQAKLDSDLQIQVDIVNLTKEMYDKIKVRQIIGKLYILTQMTRSVRQIGKLYILTQMTRSK